MQGLLLKITATLCSMGSRSAHRKADLLGGGILDLDNFWLFLSYVWLTVL